MLYKCGFPVRTVSDIYSSARPLPRLYLLAYCSEINTGEIIEEQIIVIYRNRIQTVMVVQ